MKRAVPFAILSALMLSAETQPPRETGLDIPTAQSIPVLTSCIERKLGTLYKEKPLPNGGISIEYGEQTVYFIHYQPALYVDLIETDGTRHIVIRYRHPMSKGNAAKVLRSLGRKCFPYELEASGGGILPEN